MQRLPITDQEALKPVWPLKPGVHHKSGSRTLVMGILNVTADSFSDGGCHSMCELPLLLSGSLLPGQEIEQEEVCAQAKHSSQH